MFETDQLFEDLDKTHERCHRAHDQEKWDKRFLDMAALVAAWSKDPSTKVGAVIVDPLHRVVSVGYNGLPHGMCDERGILDDRDMRLACTVHAEENAILFAQRGLAGHTLYVFPVPPCGPCAAKIRQTGIARVVAPCFDNHEFQARWEKSLEGARKVFANVVKLEFIDI